MPNVTGHTELVGLMAYPIRHTQSPTTHNLAYDKNGDDVIQLAFEVDNDSLKDAVQSIRALKMLGSNISMPNKTVVHKYLDEVDEAAKLCGAINTVVNMRDENGQVTGKLKGYNTDGMGYWQGLKEEGIDFKGMKMVLIGTGGAATAIAVRGALDGIAEIEIFNIKDKFYSRGEEIVDLINKNTNCKATMNDLADHDLLKEKMHAADLFCDATGVGMHPLEDLSNIPDTSFFKKDLIVTDLCTTRNCYDETGKRSRMRKSLQWYEHDAVSGTDCHQTLHRKRHTGRLHERKTWNLSNLRF